MPATALKINQKENHVNHDPFLTPAHLTALADALGGWELRPNADPQLDDGRRAVLAYNGPATGIQGARIELSSRDGRLHCRGSLHLEGERFAYLGDYLSYNDREAMALVITLSLSKTPAQMAGAITRRLLPRYLALFARALEGRQAAQRREQGQHALAQELADSIPVATVRQGSRPSEESQVHVAGGITLRVTPQSVRAEYFTMSHDQARLFARLIGSKAWDDARRHD
jgi:hypothetical protein